MSLHDVMRTRQRGSSTRRLQLVRRLSGVRFALAGLATAVPLLCILLIALLCVRCPCAMSEGLSSKRSIALGLAETRIEQVHSVPYDSVGTFDQVTGRYGDPAGPLSTCEETAGVTIETRVAWPSEAVPSSRATHKDVTVVASWSVPTPGQVSVSCVIYGNGYPRYTGDVRVTVTSDGPSSAPLCGARVDLLPPLAPPRLLYTDSNGVADFGNVPQVDVRFRLPFVVTVGGRSVDSSGAVTTIVSDGVVNYVVRFPGTGFPADIASGEASRAAGATPDSRGRGSQLLLTESTGYGRSPR